MVEFFADSLVNGFLQSSMMGKFIVMVQLSASIVMVGIIIGKVKQLAHVGRLTRRVSRDVMMGRDVLEYYLARHPSAHTAIENIYQGTCERLFKLRCDPPSVVPATARTCASNRRSSTGAGSGSTSS